MTYMVIIMVMRAMHSVFIEFGPYSVSLTVTRTDKTCALYIQVWETGSK